MNIIKWLFGKKEIDQETSKDDDQLEIPLPELRIEIKDFLDKYAQKDLYINMESSYKRGIYERSVTSFPQITFRMSSYGSEENIYEVVVRATNTLDIELNRNEIIAYFVPFLKTLRDSIKKKEDQIKNTKEKKAFAELVKYR